MRGCDRVKRWMAAGVVLALGSSARAALKTDFLVDALAGGDERARAEARQLLPRQGVEAVPKLLPLLVQDDPRVWWAANSVLADIAAEASAPGREAERIAVTDHLMTLVGAGQTAAAKQRGLRLLPLVVPEKYDVGPIAALLDDAELRESAREALEATGTRTASAALCAFLPRAEPEFACAVLNSLARMRDPASVPAVEKLTGHADAKVRAAAARALAWTGDPAWAPRLHMVRAMADEATAAEATDALLQLADAMEVLAADLPLVTSTFRYFAGWADKITGETVPVDHMMGHFFCYTKREPVGVCGQIIPWNFPMLMVTWKWGPALACGNTVVLKPAEQTPLTALRLGELAMEAGFPEGVINIVNGFGETAGDALVKHPGVDKIAFTGEYRTAQIIMANAAPTLKRLTFELGGKSPNIVFADADLDQAVSGAMTGIFFNQGEVCCAGSRLFVEQSIHDAFVERFARAAERRKLGDPFNPETEQGAQVSQEQFDKILKYIDIGKNVDKARCVTGGERFGDKGWFVRPTIFTGVSNDMRIAQEEIFGPVVTVLPFGNADEVIKQANQTVYGLAAAVWTRDVAKAHRLADRVRAGTVWVNCYNTFDAAAPFGGYKFSGQGRECGRDALNQYTETKTVWVNLGENGG